MLSCRRSASRDASRCCCERLRQPALLFGQEIALWVTHNLMDFDNGFPLAVG